MMDLILNPKVVVDDCRKDDRGRLNESDLPIPKYVIQGMLVYAPLRLPAEPELWGTLCRVTTAFGDGARVTNERKNLQGVFPLNALRIVPEEIQKKWEGRNS